MSTFNFLLFGAYPYIAATVLIVGCWARYDREQCTWKAGSTQMVSSTGMRVASNLFHIGVLFIIFGHIFGLLTPESVYHYATDERVRQSGSPSNLMVLLATWAQSVVTFQPVVAAQAIESVHIIYKLHVFLGMTLFVVFPFTRLVHIISGFAAPVKYLLRNYQIVRSK